MQGDDMLIRDKLQQISEQLPNVCASFLLGTDSDMAASTRYAYATELKWFFKHLIDECTSFKKIYDIKDISLSDIAKITPKDITKYLSNDKSKNKSERTIARRRSAISRFFTYLIRQGMIEHNPVLATEKISIPKKDEVIYIDILEQKRLLSAIESGITLGKKKQVYHQRYKKRDVALISLLLDTGIRISEIHNMDIKDINFKECSVIVSRKGGEKRQIYFSDEIDAMLISYLDERKMQGIYQSDNDPMFVTLKGERLSTRAIQILVEKYTDTAVPQKGGRITPHKLRASFAMEFYDSTRDIVALQQKLGHSSVSTTSIYAEATEQKQKDMRNVLESKRIASGGDNMNTQDALIDAMKVLVGSGVMTIEEAAKKLAIGVDELKQYL